MPSLSSTLGAPLHQDSGDPSSEPSGYEATVTAIGAATCTIVVPGYSEIHDFTNVPYVAPNGTPQVGDTGVAMFMDARHPILLLPGAGDEWTIGRLESLESNIEAAEAAFGSVDDLEARRP